MNKIGNIPVPEYLGEIPLINYLQYRVSDDNIYSLTRANIRPIYNADSLNLSKWQILSTISKSMMHYHGKVIKLDLWTYNEIMKVTGGYFHQTRLENTIKRIYFNDPDSALADQKWIVRFCRLYPYEKVVADGKCELYGDRFDTMLEIINQTEEEFSKNYYNLPTPKVS